MRGAPKAAAVSASSESSAPPAAAASVRRLRPTQRLAGKAVAAVLARGRVRTAGDLRLNFLANQLAFARLAQVVPKRLAARAVDRNRLRRVIREAFRHNQSAWSGYDCVFRLRSAYSRERDYAQLARALLERGDR